MLLACVCVAGLVPVVLCHQSSSAHHKPGAGQTAKTYSRIPAARVQGAAVQIFTEKGNYLLAVRDNSMGIHQRLAMVACAISVDYDHYSRRVGSGLMPFMFLPGGSDE